MNRGRVDCHAHLLPGLDDGCRSVEESIRCAVRLVEAGYSHCFCTPHIWPNQKIDAAESESSTQLLQARLDEAQVPLKLMPGGELTLSLDLDSPLAKPVVTYGLKGEVVLFDFWDATLPDTFWPWVSRLQRQGLQLMLAHPERIRCLQDRPRLIDEMRSEGMWMQGDLQCFNDPPGSRSRTMAERLLMDGKYDMLGTDLHSFDTMDYRLGGLEIVAKLVGDSAAWALTATQPARLLLGETETSA